MRFLVIGQGGREHALVRALKISPSVTEVHAVPGSVGMARDSVCHGIRLSDHAAIVKLYEKFRYDCVVVGPEVPLAEGLGGHLRAAGAAVVGPSREAARLESSKIFAKEFMTVAGVPTARFQVISSVDECLRAADLFSPPFVLKADGLAAGKGVFICRSRSDLETAAKSIFVEKSLWGRGREGAPRRISTGRRSLISGFDERRRFRTASCFPGSQAAERQR